MTGVEHYKAAEALLGQAAEHPIGTATRAALVFEAQAHAALAQAAASRVPPKTDEADEWGLVAGHGEHWDGRRYFVERGRLWDEHERELAEFRRQDAEKRSQAEATGGAA